jgi:TRAP transporter TAXI family solute receptor
MRRLSCLHPVAMLAALLLALSPATAPAADDDFFDKLLALGTGTQGGAFWPIGESLCARVNEERARQHIRCVASLTAGSVYNINAVAHGRLQLGIAQEDLVIDHVGGRRGPGFAELRQVAVLHNSPISVVVRGDKGVEALAQIKGLRINLGNRGSGQFTVSTAIVKALGLQDADFAAVTYEPTSSFERIFCGGKVDVVVEIVPHPVDVFAKLLACGGRFLDLPDDVARALIAGNPAFRSMGIAAGSYPQQSAAVASVGVRNLLVSHTRVSAESISRLVQTLARQSAALKQEQPLLATMPGVGADDGVDDGADLGVKGGARTRRAVPLHDGVLRALQP